MFDTRYVLCAGRLFEDCYLLQNAHAARASLFYRQMPANQGTGAESSRHHSSPVLAVKLDHVAEIARLIGLVSAESQKERDGSTEDGTGALNELKSYLQKWPDAYATLEDQV